MRKLLFLVLITILPVASFAADAAMDRPHWSLEFKGGTFTPDIENWSLLYGNRSMPQYGGSLAYKLLRQVEVGVEGMYSRDTGQGFAPIHGVITGKVTYEAAPLSVFVLFRGIFNENQWFVPYAGGGWTRVFYREEVQDQSVSRGSVDGYHYRAGIQLLLDGLDQDAAGNLYRDFGVFHTYLFFEAKYTKAMIDTVSTPSTSVNLGGTSLLGGLLFEF